MKNFLFRRATTLLVGLLCGGSALALNVSGTVWVDANSNGTVEGGETTTNFGGTMYVNLINGSGVVVNSVQVGANGAYTLTNVANNLTGYKLVLTNSATNANGDRVPGTYFVAGNVVGGSNTASQTGSIPGEINLRTVTTNIQNQNFRMAEQSTFDCLDGIAYQVAVPSGQSVSTLYSYNVSSGARTQIGSPAPFAVNSLIYSTVENKNILWGTMGENTLVRIGAGGGTVLFKVPALSTTNMNFNVGVELPDAYMLINSTNESVYYVIDVDPNRATYLEMVDPTNNFELKAGPNYGTPLSAPIGGSDIAYLSSAGLAYSINASATLVTLDPTTGVVATYPSPVTGLPVNFYGGIFNDNQGNIYAFNNVTGAFYKIDPVANTATFISTSTPSGGNDAASCPDALFECDTDIPIQPLDPIICTGTTTNFTVQPDGNGPFTYQWQQSSTGGASWSNMAGSGSGPNGSFSGGNTNVLTITPATTLWNGFMYRCNITSNMCVTPSSASTLTIYATPTAPTLLATTDAPVCPATTYDLNRLISSTTPAGSNIRFYTSASPSTETLVSDPTVAPAGIYYARYENSECGGPVSQPITILACQTPFGCENGVGYQVSAAGGETVSSLYAFNINTGVRTLIAPLSTTVNSLVYNSKDNMLWATINYSSSIVRINAEGGLQEFVVPNLPSAFYNVGVELPDGYMLVYVGGQASYYVIDIDQSRSTFLRLVDPTNGFALKTGPNYGIALSTAVDLADFAFLPSTQLCYGILSANGRLVTLNPFTGQVTVGAVVRGISFSPFGAFFSDATGKLYGFHNASGSFYNIDPATASASLISTAISSFSNDGTRSPVPARARRFLSRRPVQVTLFTNGK
jgi:hypothetical protein